VTESPFYVAFDRFCSEMRYASWNLPEEGRLLVQRFLDGTRHALLAVVRESEMMNGDMPAAVLSDAGKVVALIERLGHGYGRGHQIAVAAVALITLADPIFEERIARKERA